MLEVWGVVVDRTTKGVNCVLENGKLGWKQKARKERASLALIADGRLRLSI